MDFFSPDQPKMFFRKITQINGNKFRLDADMIRLLIAIDETKELEQIADEVGMDHARLNTTLSKLLEIKLVEPIQTDIPYLDNEFITALKINLSQAVGPMAEILIDDVAVDMNVSVSEIPKAQAAEFISALSLEIPDEDTSVQFKKAMLELIKMQQE
jgi:predicted transcriptional regulator